MSYFKSEEYRRSLHSRTLLVTGIPNSMQSDKGLIEFMELIKVKFPISETVIARDVGDLPELVVEREEVVRDLEHVLVKYLKGNYSNCLKKKEIFFLLNWNNSIDSFLFM